MDAIDILGSILKHASSRSGKGTDVLNDVFKRRSRAQPDSRSTPSDPVKPRPGDIKREAQDLEDLLNVANDRYSQRSAGKQRAPQLQPRSDISFQRDRPAPDQRDSRSGRPSSSGTISEHDRALVLVRAMLNAAKSDGQIDRSEQQSILERLGDSSHDAIQFLREEFDNPLDVREFAWSVPMGMEQQVYTMSLIAIDLDTSREAKYLLELARGLRIPDEVREQIHQRLGAPSIH